ncbi:MAG: hypothetical protein ACFCU6_06255, partial [Balneolaceae bacterium]
SGQIEFFRKPIEPPPFPVINPPASGDSSILLMSEASIMQQTDSSVIQDDTFHVLVQKRKKPNDEWLPRFVDVYDFQNGDYLYSYHLPEENYSDFTIYKDYLIALKRTDLPEIVIWKTDNDWNYNTNHKK